MRRPRPTMCNRFCILALAGIGSLALLATSASAEATLRYQFRPGETTHYVMTQSMTMSSKIPNVDQPIEMQMKQTMFMDLAVQEVLPDGSARQKQTIRRIKLAMKSSAPNGPNIEYDSEDGKVPEGPLAALMLKSIQPLVGAELEQTLTPRGEVSNVTIPQKMIDALKANPGAAMMGDLATPEGLKQMTSQTAMAFPETPLKLNDNWSSSFDVKMPFGTMTTKKTTTYLGPGEGSLERMGLATDVSFTPLPNAPASLKIVDNEADGQVLFDNRLGRLQKTSLTQTTSMQITVGAQTIDQQVKTDVLFELDPTDR